MGAKLVDVDVTLAKVDQGLLAELSQEVALVKGIPELQRTLHDVHEAVILT